MVHHVVARGIERRQIFMDDHDREIFLKRLTDLIQETENPLYTFAILPNHFHLLIRRGKTPVHTFMQRLLTAYAIYFNKRHGRSGHLFQNRYKSFACTDEGYFTVLLRYISLNPVRAGQCSCEELKYFKYCGHAYILGNRESSWLASNEVLSLFGDTLDRSREAFARLMVEDNNPTPKNEVISMSTATRSGFIIPYSDEKQRDMTLPAVTKPFKSGFTLIETGESDPGEPDVSALYSQVIIKYDVTEKELMSKNKTRKVVLARARLAKDMSRHLGMTRSDIARELAVSPSAVSKMLGRKKENQDR
ncbi:MAG: transposase [Thermoleophilia bacterium]